MRLPDLAITYKTGRIELKGHCDASWGDNPTSANLLKLPRGFSAAKVSMQGPVMQSIMKDELSPRPTRARM